MAKLANTGLIEDFTMCYDEGDHNFSKTLSHQ